MTPDMASTLELKVTSSDIGLFIGRLNNSDISLYGIKYLDFISAEIVVKRSDIQRVCQWADKCGAKLEVLDKHGLYWRLFSAIHRPVLLLAICLLFILSIWIPSRVFFISVDGNEKISDLQIIEQANRCGIQFGAPRRKVRSEQMKNSLLDAMPALQWAGINTSGCTAIISVKERSESLYRQQTGYVNSIVAARDGIIESCTSLRGNLKCQIGDAVTKDQVLISAYTDLGLCVQATSAAGEVYAQTKHDVVVLFPLNYEKKTYSMNKRKKYGLLIGKKRINFNKCSGISGVGCDRIYLDYYVTLPGGFVLPFGFFIDTVEEYECVANSDATAVSDVAVKKAAREYLLSNMISGKILQEVIRFCQEDDICVLSGQYVCSEMISRVKYEEIYEHYGEGN